jgi:hypothetical protein
MNPMEDAAQGAAIGTVKGFFKSISDWWHERHCKQCLREMLMDPRFEFRTMQRLADRIGMDNEKTRRLLVAIGARPSATNADLWTLKPPPS